MAILIVEDDSASARLLTRMLPRQMVVRHAARRLDAIRMLRAHDDWRGFLIDVHLGKDFAGGLGVLEAVSDRFEGLPTAMISGNLDGRVINAAAAHGASFIAKPYSKNELEPFLVAAQSAGAKKDPLIAGVARFAQRFKFSPRQHEILKCLVLGQSREDFMAHSQISKSTWKSHIRAICAKSKVDRTTTLVNEILRDVCGRRTSAPDLDS